MGWATLVVAVPTRCLQDVMGDLSRGHRRTANEVSGSGVNPVQLRDGLEPHTGGIGMTPLKMLLLDCNLGYVAMALWPWLSG